MIRTLLLALPLQTPAAGQDRLAAAIERLAAALEQSAASLAARAPATAETATEASGGGAQDLAGLRAWLDALRERAIHFLPQLLAAAAVLVLGWMLARILTGFLRRALARSRLDPTLSNFLASCAHMAMISFVVVSAVTQLGVNTASFVAVLGAAGFAVGFAMQGSLSNFAAGVMLMIFRPLRAGDFVEAGGVTGTVVEVGVFHTILTTAQGRRAIVANSSITGGNIVNSTAAERLRVDMQFGIGYDDDLERAISVLRRVLAEDERVLKDPAPIVALLAHGASSLDLACRPFVKPGDYWDVWFQTHKRVREEFAREGISIPFPQRDVHLYQVST